MPIDTESTLAKPLKIDVGMVKVGEIVTGTINVRNPTPSELKIRDVAVSCGCLRIDRFDAPIEAGKEASLSFQLSVNLAGPILQRAVIHTDNSNYDAISVEVHGIGSGIWSRVRSFNLGTYIHDSSSVSKDEGGNTYRFPVFITGYSDAAIDQISTSESCVDLSVSEIASFSESTDLLATSVFAGNIDAEKVRGWMVAVSMNDKVVDSNASSALISVCSNRAGCLHIPVYFTAERFATKPKRLLFASVPAGSEHSLDAFLERDSRNSLILREISVISDNEAIDVFSQEVPTGLKITCIARPSKDASSGVITGRLSGVANGETIFSLPYTVVVKPKLAD